MRQIIGKTAAVLAAGAFAGACAHAQARAAAPAPVPVAQTAAPAAQEPTPAQAADDIARLFAGDVLHFSLDSSNLSANDRGRLDKIADAMRQHPDLKIRISGNCDERGTEDYNLALGQRRASAAQKYLMDMGVEQGRIGTISYGKDRPLSDGHDEAAWSQNRRDEFSRND